MALLDRKMRADQLAHARVPGLLVQLLQPWLDAMLEPRCQDLGEI
jgi:hypothetical protein